MNLTINGVPVAVDQLAAEEIVRKHLLNGEDPRRGSLPDHEVTVPYLERGEKFIGSYSGPDARVVLAILMPIGKKKITWSDAMAWAKDQGGDLPNRIEQALLWAHHRAEFDAELYWSNESVAGDVDYAWCQSFLYGYQRIYHKGSKLDARAVRRVAI